MSTQLVQAKSLLIERDRIDAWFVARYHMNIYRGCHHDCAYCDGRAESYHVVGEFGRDVTAKANAPQLLARALDPMRRRKPPTPDSFVLVGGGVGDCYEPSERKHELTRGVLEVLAARAFPAHVLTKSSLVERDFDLLDKIHARRRAIVSMSFSTVDDQLAQIFERGATPPSQRLETLARAKARGFATGIYLMPVLPFVCDDRASLQRTLAEAKRVGVDFVLFGGLTLKAGRQAEHYFETLRRHRPDAVARTQALYAAAGRYGGAPAGYAREIDGRFAELARQQGLARRIPAAVFDPILSDNDRAVVLLDNLDVLARYAGRPAPYGRAARAIAALKEPVRSLRGCLHTIEGVAPPVLGALEEIVETGVSSLHERLL